MRSIRLSLVVCFLLLLAAALGAASFFVYQTSAQALQAKDESRRQLIDREYKENSQQEEQQLDEDLLRQAQALARQAQTQFDWRKARQREDQVTFLGLFAWPAAGGPPTALLWAAEATRGFRHPFTIEIYRNTPPEIRIDLSQLLEQTIEGQKTNVKYFQIDSAWGASYRSESLGDTSFRGPPSFSADGPGAAEDYSEDMLGPDHERVRRVLIKTWVRFTPPQFGRHPGDDHGGRGGHPPGRPPDDRMGFPDVQPHSAIIVQCAIPLSRLDESTKVYADKRRAALAELDAQTRESLAGLRNRLLLIGGVTFAVAALACYGLVFLGLSPLRRVSDAVSRVSAKDFSLQVDRRRLPNELKPIVQRLTDTLEQLKRAFAREKQATADISHELRTPLAALLTTTEMALRKPRSTEEYQELLQECRLSAQQMTRAVERLLALARLDAGVDRMRPREVDAGDLAEQCAALVRPLAEARGLRLTVHRNGPAPVMADPDKLREVLTNLLHNAVQYNRPDGSIDVTVARGDGRLRVEVADTGVGIGPEDKAHIFERFYRADSSRGEDGLHAGLGLAIVKGYLDLMGGAIEVDSEKGRGSTFRVLLPA
jgi:heavy metal sensor kinase